MKLLAENPLKFSLSLNYMTLRQIVAFILRQFSAGNFIQNIGFYTLLVLLVWIFAVQFKQLSQKYRVN